MKFDPNDLDTLTAETALQMISLYDEPTESESIVMDAFEAAGFPYDTIGLDFSDPGNPKPGHMAVKFDEAMEKFFSIVDELESLDLVRTRPGDETVSLVDRWHPSED